MAVGTRGLTSGKFVVGSWRSEVRGDLNNNKHINKYLHIKLPLTKAQTHSLLSLDSSNIPVLFVCVENRGGKGLR